MKSVIYLLILLLTALTALVSLIGQIVWESTIFQDMWSVASLVTLVLTIPFALYGFSRLESDKRVSVVLLTFLSGGIVTYSVYYVILP